MVKGVNKTIIEVNNTGNKFFEKIVFYVTPEYGNSSPKQLRRAAEGFICNYAEDFKPLNDNSFRRRYKIKRRRRILATVFCGLAVVCVGLIIIL